MISSGVMMSKHTYTFWQESHFDVFKGCHDAILPDAILAAACEHTPAEVKIAVESNFLGTTFLDATGRKRADALILNAIFWIMNQSGFDDFSAILETYIMPEQYEDGFRILAGMEDPDPKKDEEKLYFSNFDHDEWEARYNMS